MAYFYIKTSGTATGDAGRFTSLQTGAFTLATSYASVAAAQAATTAPTTDDYYLFSDAIAETLTGDVTWTLSKGSKCISVADANRDTYSRGAQYTQTGGGEEFFLNGENLQFEGMQFVNESQLYLGDNWSLTTFRDCRIEGTDATKALIYEGSAESSYLKFFDCDLIVDTGEVIRMSKGCHMEFYGGTITGTATSELVSGQVDATGTLYFEGVDLSGMATTGTLVNCGTSSIQFDVKFHRCRMPSAYTNLITTATLASRLNSHVTECAKSGDDSYFGFEDYDRAAGTAEINTTTKLDATYDGTTGFSVSMDSNADANRVNPQRYKIHTFANQDLSTAKTVTIECTSATASLTDVDVWIDAIVNNNTSESLGEIKTTRNTNVLSAGTALSTTGTGTWTSGGGNDYIITLDLGARAAVDNGNVDIYANVAKASITVNFDLPTIAAT